jgi:hypothetical protein
MFPDQRRQTHRCPSQAPRLFGRATQLLRLPDRTVVRRPESEGSVGPNRALGQCRTRMCRRTVRALAGFVTTEDGAQVQVRPRAMRWRSEPGSRVETPVTH